MAVGSFMPIGSRWDAPLADLAARLPGHRILVGPQACASRIGELDAIVAGRIDHDLLREATYPRSGRVGAPSRLPIHRLPNVILSPHVGGSTHQAWTRSVADTCLNLETWPVPGRSDSEADLRAMY